MAATIEQVSIRGLRDFQAALKQMDDGAQKQLRVVLNKASELVLSGARKRVPTKTGAAVASLKAASSQREASIRAGSRKAPYYPWLDFGGRVGIGKSVKRPFLAKGRYIYREYDAVRPRVLGLLEAELAALAKNAGLTVT